MAEQGAELGVTGPDRWHEVEHLLNAALELGKDARHEFVRNACGSDEILRHEVSSLLEAHEGDGAVDRLASAIFSADASLSRGALDVAGRTIRQYRVAARLGGGGMGVVYEARDLRLDRAVALKFLAPSLSADPDAKQRFLIEAQAAAALDHPNICTIYEIAETDEGQLFIAMPRYQGETVQGRIRRGPLPIDDAVAIALQTARALAAAHEVGIVHRDVKPANVFLTVEGVVKLLDFGIAKLEDVSLTRHGATPGTVAYMSPEQARGDTVDARTDVWSLGVVFYEMLTGVRPFRGSHDQVVLRSILETDPEQLSSLRPDVSAALARVVHRALDKRREARHGSARELLREIERLPSIEARGDREVPAGRHPPIEEPRLTSPTPVGVSVLPEGDRRLATIVVSHLSGYAAMMEALPTDEVERVMERLRLEATEIATRHEGVIHQFSGDQMQLVFGIPVTHEDDCRRAVRAALDLQERVRAVSREARLGIGLDLRLHTGIDTGQVATRPSGGPETEFRVAGSASQIAVRLSAHASADQVLLSPECHRLVAPFFTTMPEPPISVRDRAKDLVPHRVLGESGLQTRLEAAAPAGLTPYTGRDAELEVLQQALDQARRAQGRLVTVIGDAGIGKSRLLYEFCQRHDRDSVSVLQGRCQSYGGGVAYLPFIDTLRQSLQLDDAGPVARQREQLVARVREIAPELEEFIPLYLHLLSIPAGELPVPKHLLGQQFPLAMQEALTAILTLSARRRPVILVLEDWHWVDNASHAVLGHLAEMLSDYPLLVVMTCRPGWTMDSALPGLHTTIHLRPLEASSSVAMLKSVMRVLSIPEPLGTLLHERTGGNPFFLEEICQTLLEDGTLRAEHGRATLVGSLDTLELPDTVQAVIRARLDRLRPDARDVLRLASVVGREFTRKVLERTLENSGWLPTALQSLKAAGLIQQTQVVPDAAYRFKHVLTQEVAYASLLEHQRKTLHGRVGVTIEDLHVDRIDEHLERLAHHFSRAEQWAKAVHYGMRSAERDTTLSRFAEAFQMLERTQGWVMRLPEGPERRGTLTTIWLRQERLCETLGNRGRQQRIIDELIALLEPAGDNANLAEAYLRQGDVYTLLRRFDAAEEALTASLHLRRDSSDVVGERNTIRSLGLLRWHEGRHAEALQFVEQALTIDHDLVDVEAMVGDLSNMGAVLRAMGQHDRARTHLEEALSLSERALSGGPDPRTASELTVRQSYILHNLANIHRELGDADRALEYLHRSRDLALGRKLPIQLSYHLTTMAHMTLREGKVEESLQLYHEAVELTRKARYASGLAQSLRFLGEVLLGLNRNEESLAHFQEAAALFSQLKDRATEARMWSRVAEVHERGGRDPDAIAAWSKSRSLWRQAGDARGELESLEGLARVTRRHVSEPSLALGYYRDALALAQSLGDLRAEGRLCNALGIVEWSRGELEEALAHYERARAVFEALHDQLNLGLMLNCLGVTLRDLGRRVEARDRLEEAIEIHRAGNQLQLQGHALAVLGDVAAAMGDTNGAQRHYEDSLEIRRATGDRAGEGWMLHHIARTLLGRGLLEEGHRLAGDAASIADAVTDPELKTACERLRHLTTL